MNFRVLLKQTDEGFAIWCPTLKGCWSAGATEEEALKNIGDAIEEYLQAVHDLSQPADAVEREVTVKAQVA